MFFHASSIHPPVLHLRSSLVIKKKKGVMQMVAPLLCHLFAAPTLPTHEKEHTPWYVMGQERKKNMLVLCVPSC